MKRQSLIVTVVLIAALLSMASPAAANDNQPVGERIGLYSSAPMEFPAGEPFNIRHGWSQVPQDGAIGIFDFELEVDGISVGDGLRWFTAVGDPPTLTRLWVYNFPDGMTGTHTFTGHWYAPCQYAADYLGYTETCKSPNQKVETNSRSRIVTFTP